MKPPPEETAPEAARPAPTLRRRAVRVAAELGALLLTGAAVTGLTLYVVRREAAEDFAHRWLRDQGLDGVLDVDRLDADGFSGSLRIGPQRDPDFTVDRIEVDLEIDPAWSDTPFRIGTRAVRLVRPRLKARLDDRGLTFGRLDPAVRRFLDRPDSGEPGPLVLIEDGAVRLLTPYGPLRLRGGGALAEGRIVRLEARSRPVVLEGERLAADLGEGVIRLAGRDGRLTGRASVPVRRWESGGAEMVSGEMLFDVDAPYPEGRDLRLDGPLTLEAGLSGERVALSGVAAQDGRLRAGLVGRISGPVARPEFIGALDLSGGSRRLEGTGLRAATVNVRAEDLSVEGRTDDVRFRGQASLTASEAVAAGGRLSRVRLSLETQGGRIRTSDGRPQLAGPAVLAFQADAYRAENAALSSVRGVARSDLSLLAGARRPLAVESEIGVASLTLGGRPAGVSAVRVRLEGPAEFGGDLFWRAAGSASARGALATASGSAVADRLPVIGDEAAHRGVIVAALADFGLQAPRLTLNVDEDGVAAGLPQAATLQSRSGAQLTLADGAGPVWTSAGERTSGDAVVRFSGGGLPSGALALTDWSLRGDDFAAEVRLQARDLQAPPARGAAIELAGRARLSDSRFMFDAAGCAPASAAEVEVGENDLQAVSAQVCPVEGASLLVADDRGWRLRGRFQRTALSWPVAEAKATAASGGFDISGGPAGLVSGDVRVAAATVTDTAAETRYLPVGLSGSAALRAGVWRGRFGVESGTDVTVAQVDLVHEDASGIGAVDIDATSVTFAPEGLQPDDLTLLTAGWLAEARGVVDFTGRVDWTEAGVTSRGRVATGGLDFRSPVGAVTQLAGAIELTSLSPLISASDQTVTARTIDALAEITDAATQVTLTPEALTLGSTRFAAAGGVLSIDRLAVPLDGGGRYAGTVKVDGVQLGQVLEALNLGEAIDLDAVVDGAIPFEIAPGQVRFSEGRLTARQPGRVEISREALTGVQTSAAGAPQAVNAVQEFAYQAMENLSFETLKVEVNSLPEGRLGLLFRIEGRHDPETPEEARVGWLEALRGDAFQRRIPLPAGTPVNLTLDTTLNFDELLQAWLDVSRSWAAEATRSAPVQAPPLKETS